MIQESLRSMSSGPVHLPRTETSIVQMGDDDRSSSTTTLVPDESSSNWSDCALTGSFSGRYSWGADEADFEKEMAEKVRKKFDVIDAALYNGKTTGKEQIDEECTQWSTTFPHLMVQGMHLFDSIDDGTDMIDPDPFLMLDASTNDTTVKESSQDLEVIGTRIRPKAPSLFMDCSQFCEEVMASEGVVEEYFAFNNSVDDSISETTRRSRLRRHCGLPPLTPNAAVKDTVCNLLFDQIWNETVAILQPLVALMREKGAVGQHSSNYALGDVLLPPLATPDHGELLQQQPYILRGLRDPPTLTNAPGPSGAKFLRFKPSSGNLPSTSTTLPQIASNLSGVMQIRSVSLQHRMPSVVNDASREGTPALMARPDTSIGTRLMKSNTPLPPRLSDYQLPVAPGTRLVSGRVATSSRRNIVLKPIDRPKTPALEPIDSCIRGYRLSTNHSTSSPPSTPFTRNNQLPPLETTLSSGTNMGSISSFEKSPSFQIRTSAREKNRATFNSRIVSAADAQDSWRSKGDEIRPSTTSNSFRQDGPSKSTVGRKMSDHALHYLGNMKVVGHAAGHYGAEAIEVISSKDKFSTSIAEDDELLESDGNAFAVTGTAGYFQSRPSARTKLRGHVR